MTGLLGEARETSGATTGGLLRYDADTAMYVHKQGGRSSSPAAS